MNPIYIFYVSIVLIFSGFFVSLCSGLIYLLYRFVKNKYLYDYITAKRNIFIRRVFIFSIPIITFWITFRAFFPGNGFFKDEFTDITKIDFPKKGKIVSKYADYPDFHGDYSSCALIELNQDEYIQLKEIIKSDTSFTKGIPYGSSCYENASLDKVDFNKLDGYKRIDEFHHFLYIGFQDDIHVIIIFKSVT